MSVDDDLLITVQTLEVELLLDAADVLHAKVVDPPLRGVLVDEANPSRATALYGAYALLVLYVGPAMGLGLLLEAGLI